MDRSIMKQPSLGESARDNINGDENMKTNKNKTTNSKSRRIPSPRELVSYYEKQGIGSEEASFKVIEDLQSALFRTITTAKRRRQRSPLDAVESRLLNLEMKLDSKPNYPQAFAIGLASNAVWSGAVQIWNLIRRTTSSSS